MAEVLKYYYPRHVDLHNYSPANRKSWKIDNWNTLNRKVLCKLGIHVSNSTIEDIVSFTGGAVQQVLTKVHRKIQEGEKNSLSQSSMKMLPSRSLNGQNLAEQYEEMVPLTELEKRNRELSEKQETISILSLKVTHLESLLQLKDQRIKDLSAQLQRYQMA
ncbi:sperm flagellar protein 1-like isoform X2 [Periplaneta americana]